MANALNKQQNKTKKQDKIKKRNKIKQRQRQYPIVYLLPLIMILAVIPLMIHQYRFNTGLTQYNWFQGDASTSDLFLHVKMVWSYAMFITILCFMIYMIFSEEIKPVWDRILIPILVYGALSFLSALFSINRHYSFSGIQQQFESVWMLLGYVLLVYYSFFILYQENAVKRLMPYLIGGITIMTLFGLLQALKIDPLHTKFLQNLIVIDKKLIGKIKFSFEEGRTFMSLYNPNYVGYYVVIMVPILVALIMHTEKVLLRIFYAFLAAALVFVLFASQSRAGVLVLVATFLVMLLCMRKVFFKNWKLTLGIIVVATVAFIVVNMMNQNVLIGRMRSMFSSSPQNYALEYIETGKDVTFCYKGNEIHFSMEREKGADAATFHVVDGDGKEVASILQTETNVYQIMDERFPFVYAEMYDRSFRGFYVEHARTGTGNDAFSPTKRWLFSNQYKQNDSTYYIKGAGASFFHLKRYQAGDGFLEKHHLLANKRGYIWARTLPLLKKYPLLGSGPDTFVIAYPNDDLVGLYNSGHDVEIVTRPHCMYLQIAAQTGIPSLIAFLVFFGWYFIRSFKLYWKQSYDSYMSKIGLAVMISIMGYLILGLTNDSSVVISPVFFVLTGMGLGINRHLESLQK
ncbi:MAG: O-antigen ligase family protein [Lachnospiraceae bacterium]|nr:O-antigen ligase family protein [Lachnospiraceae bacterium]